MAGLVPAIYVFMPELLEEDVRYRATSVGMTLRQYQSSRPTPRQAAVFMAAARNAISIGNGRQPAAGAGFNRRGDLLPQTRSAALANAQFGVEIPKSRIAARFAFGLVLRDIRCPRLTMPDRRRKRPADIWGCGRRRDCDGGTGTGWRALRHHDADLPREHQSSTRTNDPFGRLMHHTPRLLASSRASSREHFVNAGISVGFLCPNSFATPQRLMSSAVAGNRCNPGSQPIHNL